MKIWLPGCFAGEEEIAAELVRHGLIRKQSIVLFWLKKWKGFR
jgi:hypothetical protein